MRHRRTEFTSETKRHAFARSNGTCECHRIPWLNRPQGCGAKVGPANTFYEHITTDFHSSDNSIENCAVLCKTCWRSKTSQHDIPSIAKTKRVQDFVRNIKPIVRRPLPGTVASGIKISFNRQPTWRDSGKPLWSSRR